MELKNLPIFALLSVAVVVSHAALPAEEYWDSLLPNTAMPKAVKDLLHTSQSVEEERVSVVVGNGGVHVDPNNPGEVHVNIMNHTHVNGGRKGGSVSVGGGKGGSFSDNKRDGNVSVRVAPPGVKPFLYNYAATETQLHDDPTVALFFLEKDLYAGNKMSLHFSKVTNDQQGFLPRQVADSIPFSSSKLPEIYTRLSVKPGSYEAEAIKKTIQECEDTGIKGEEKFCATSLESMIAFSTSKIGKEVDAVSTHADSSERKVYRIVAVTKKPGDKPVVVCHKQEYAYAVFYCHKTNTAVAYDISLVGAGGSKADAVAVCHRDTAAWNPKHLAFQVLKVKPGSVPICHYLPEDHIVWVSKN